MVEWQKLQINSAELAVMVKKKKCRNTLIFCVGECKIPLNVKSKFSFFQNLTVQSRCLIFVKVPIKWIDANSRCMQKK